MDKANVGKDTAMMFLWEPEKVRYMKEAYEYNETHLAVGAKVAELLPSAAHVCDAGCGLGYLSLALSPYFKKVTAIDRATGPLDVLRQNISTDHIENIDVIETDIFMHVPLKPYDAMVFSMFGDVVENLRLAKVQCSGTVIMIFKSWESHRFAMKNRPIHKCTLGHSKEALEALNIPYELETMRLKMGQPFYSKEDAVAFYQLYSREAHPHQIDFNAIKARVSRNHSERFPLYSPMDREVGIFSVKTSDIGDVDVSTKACRF
jgi:protein-L-isoaspartate O-methyltransferase